jgi:hypothetical protein
MDSLTPAEVIDMKENQARSAWAQVMIDIPIFISIGICCIILGVLAYFITRLFR